MLEVDTSDAYLRRGGVHAMGRGGGTQVEAHANGQRNEGVPSEASQRVRGIHHGHGVSSVFLASASFTRVKSRHLTGMFRGGCAPGDAESTVAEQRSATESLLGLRIRGEFKIASRHVHVFASFSIFSSRSCSAWRDVFLLFFSAQKKTSLPTPTP